MYIYIYIYIYIHTYMATAFINYWIKYIYANHVKLNPIHISS